jgi:hypothetical protein
MFQGNVPLDSKSDDALQIATAMPLLHLLFCVLGFAHVNTRLSTSKITSGGASM